MLQNTAQRCKTQHDFSMVKSMTGFPRDSDSESDSGASDDEPPKSKSATAVRKQAVGVRARTNGRFKSSSRARGGPCVRETPRGGARASCSVVLPSGLRDVSSVVIVFDPVFGPRLRRVLDDTTCEENEHKHERRDELYAVSVSRTRTSSAVTVRSCLRGRLRALLPCAPVPRRVRAHVSFVRAWS